MIQRIDITPAEFDRRRDRLRSRWSEMIESLKPAAPGYVFPIFLRAEENTGKERKRARQSIYAITKHHGIRIRLCSTPLAILVMKCGAVDGCTVCPECHRATGNAASPLPAAGARP